MDQLLNSVTSLVTDAMEAAGNLAGGAVDAASDAAQAYIVPFMATAQSVYATAIASGKTPEQAMDITERTMRDLTGQIII